MEISIVTASRGRPKDYANMVASALANASRPERIEFLVAFDDDDPSKDDYTGYTRCIIAPRAGAIIPANNLAMNESKADIAMLVMDRCLFKSHGWDDILRDRLLGRVAMLWPNNGDKRHLCVMFAMSREYMNAEGFFFDTQFEHFYCDTVAGVIGTLSGCGAYCHEILVEQLHAKWGTASKDETWADRRRSCADGTTILERDRERWFTAEEKMNAVAERIKLAAEQLARCAA